MIDLAFRLPPFNLRVRSPFDAVAQHMKLFYGDLLDAPRPEFIDFDIRLEHGTGLHRFWRPQARFLVDNQDPFIPLPVDQAAPMFEWGLNWAIASRALGYVVLHAAVLAKDDQAIILPGFPGAGKSTMCASLCHLAQWRLFSDELAILDPQNDLLIPNPRPINLKNTSIDLVANFSGARIGPRYHDTRKGTVAHAAAPTDSLLEAERPARPRWLVFPQFRANAPASIESMSRTEAFTLIQEQSFNRERMGAIGFQAVCTMLSSVECYSITYGSTQDGLSIIRELTSSGTKP